MFSFKRLNECTLDEVVQVWNEGFTGYFFNATMTIEMFVNRLVIEELSPTLSFVAYKGDRPVGIVLNGVRTIQGSKIAWNGGTGVIPELRGTGVGKELVDHAVQIYREEQVKVATLEAISENDKAIRLYIGKGYEVVDDILYMSNDAAIPELIDYNSSYIYSHGTPHDVKEYATMLPWQAQWANFRRDGETVLAYENGEIIAYALFKRTYDAAGKNIGAVISQCHVLNERSDQENIIRFLLSKAARPELTSYKRTVPMLASNAVLRKVLSDLGFKPTSSQVFMTKEM